MTKTAEKPKPAARKPTRAPRKKKAPAEEPLERVLELIDEEVKARAGAVLRELEATDKLRDLVAQARNKGATMPDLARRVQRLDRSSRQLVPITRQALDAMLNAEHDTSKRDERTAESRRRAEKMHAFHVQGHSLRETGERFGGISAQTVSALFSRHGLEVRRGRHSIARGRINADALA